MDLTGTNALVTGGAVRVGRSIASALAAEGANVYIHYNRSSGPAEELASELQSTGVRVAVGSANLSDPESASGLIEQATEALGPVSVLVNSASGFPEDTIADVTLDQLRTTHDLTLPEGGSIHVVVTEDGEPVPARVQLLPTSGDAPSVRGLFGVGREDFADFDAPLCHFVSEPAHREIRLGQVARGRQFLNAMGHCL